MNHKNSLPKIPLIVVLVTAFVALTIIAAGLVGYLSFVNGQRAVNDVAGQLRHEVTIRITEHLNYFLNTPTAINQTNTTLLRQALLSNDDPAAFEHYLWAQIQIFETVSSIYFGNTAGGLVDAGREGTGGPLYVIATDDFVAGPFNKYAVDETGARTDLLLSIPNFDAASRPWYTGAVATANQFWSDPYILFTGQDMAIAASAPVYDQQDNLLGVVSVDLFLTQLHDFLQALNIGETGEAFIIDDQGLLIASSAEEIPFTAPDDDGEQRRLAATESRNPLIRQVAQSLPTIIANDQPIRQTRQFEIPGHNDRLFVQVAPLTQIPGLDWLVIVVIPESDFMTQIQANNVLTIGLIVLTLLVAVAIGIFASRRLVGPILQLNQQAAALAQGNWTKPVTHQSHITEINALTQSFNKMAAQLQETVASLTTEVAERKQAEQARRQGEEYLRTTLNSIGDAVLTTDTSGIVVDLNPVAEHLTGWPQAEARGCPLTDVFKIVDAQTGEPLTETVAAILQTGNVLQFDRNALLLSKTGASCPIADSGAPIQTENGEVTGVVLVFRDITKQLRSEQEMLKTAKLESLGLLAGGIAHDFNNLFTGLYGNIELARMFLSPAHKSFKFLESAGHSMDQAINLANQLLTFARGGDPMKATLSMGDVLQETAEFSLRGSDISLQTDIAADLWPIEGDKGQLSQVISNLVINAKQAMPQGGQIDITAQNHPQPDGDFVRITLADQGKGIDPQIIDKIFDPYFTTKAQGNGLGLATTYSIIAKHQGYILVNSAVGQGTVFTILLPAIQRAVENGDHPHSPVSAVTLQLRILLLDDDVNVRQVLRMMLQQLGHLVDIATEGQAAIERYRAAYQRETPYDLVIVDLTIPGGLGGVDTAREILAVNQNAKIIVSSGYATDPVMANYQDYGFVGRVAKPYQLSDLERAIHESLP